mmetsp:Transcript_1550/g.4497  ORF Transcript_1550/g.4497 Transcript_1550/m.4497 type:complete len:294 (-) Transcript_1550:200-1081(-)
MIAIFFYLFDYSLSTRRLQAFVRGKHCLGPDRAGLQSFRSKHRLYIVGYKHSSFQQMDAGTAPSNHSSFHPAGWPAPPKQVAPNRVPATLCFRPSVQFHSPSIGQIVPALHTTPHRRTPTSTAPARSLYTAVRASSSIRLLTLRSRNWSPIWTWSPPRIDGSTSVLRTTFFPAPTWPFMAEATASVWALVRGSALMMVALTSPRAAFMRRAYVSTILGVSESRALPARVVMRLRVTGDTLPDRRSVTVFSLLVREMRGFSRNCAKAGDVAAVEAMARSSPSTLSSWPDLDAEV